MDQFERADLDGDGRISRAEAVAFFQGSGLPEQVISEIWSLSDRSRSGFLGREDFYNFLRLVTVAQSERALTPETVNAALDAPAPPEAPDMNQFEAYFKRADLDGDGRISKAEAVGFFQGSGLPEQVISEIWSLSDRSCSGFLGREDFYNSLRLVTVAQSKIDLTPEIVNAALNASAPAEIPPPKINLSAITAPQPNPAATMVDPGAPNANVEQNYFPPQQNQLMRPNQGISGMTSLRPTTGPKYRPSAVEVPAGSVSRPPQTVLTSVSIPGSSTFNLNNSYAGNTSGYSSGFGRGSLAAPSLIDPKALVVSGNGSDMFSSFQPKQEPTLSNSSVSSAIVSTSAGTTQPLPKPNALNYVQNTFSMLPAGNQPQQPRPAASSQPAVSSQSPSSGLPPGNAVGPVHSTPPWPEMKPSDVQRYTQAFMVVGRNKDGKITSEQMLDWDLVKQPLMVQGTITPPTGMSPPVPSPVPHPLSGLAPIQQRNQGPAFDDPCASHLGNGYSASSNLQIAAADEEKVKKKQKVTGEPSSSSALVMEDRKYVDWLKLPTELTADILHRIGGIEILENAQKVCRSWRSLCRDPLMWKNIDMHNNGCCMDYDLEIMSRHAFDRSKGGLVSISLWFFATDALLNYIASRLHKLTTLSLVSCYPVTDKGFIAAVVKLSLLEKLEISYCGLTEESLKIAGQSCRNLKTFKLNCIGYRKPRDECDREAQAIAETMPKLSHLQLFGNRLTNSGLKAILDNCLSLEQLDLRQCFNVLVVGDLERQCSERIKVLRLPEDSTEDYPYDATTHQDISDEKL